MPARLAIFGLAFAVSKPVWKSIITLGATLIVFFAFAMLTAAVFLASPTLRAVAEFVRIV